MSDIEARLRELKIELPLPAKPAANYVPGVVSGNLLFSRDKARAQRMDSNTY